MDIDIIRIPHRKAPLTGMLFWEVSFCPSSHTLWYYDLVLRQNSDFYFVFWKRLASVLHLCPYNHSRKVRVEEIPVEYSWVQRQPDSRWVRGKYFWNHYLFCGKHVHLKDVPVLHKTEHPSYLSFLVLTITILIVVMACDINIGGVIPNISESASKYKARIMFPQSSVIRYEILRYLYSNYHLRYRIDVQLKSTCFYSLTKCLS